MFYWDFYVGDTISFNRMTVDAGLHNPGDVLRLCHGSDPAQAATLSVEARNGCAVALTLPAAGVAVYA